MNRDQKFDAFKALHQQQGTAFVMPNPWDAGTARLLTDAGFQALATTSAGYAFAAGKRDSFSSLSCEEILINAKAIVDATDLPVSADLEDGFGRDPTRCSQTIGMAIDIGLVGGSIEDATGDPDEPVLPIGLATDRIRAAAEAAKDRGFLLTGRAENFISGRPDLADTIKRLQAYSEAGADVLYAPGLPDLGAISTICREVDKPVNVVMGLSGQAYTVPELSAAGVRRISVGGSFARAALGALRRAAEEVMHQGTFTYAKAAIPDGEMAALMDQTKQSDRS